MVINFRIFKVLTDWPSKKIDDAQMEAIGELNEWLSKNSDEIQIISINGRAVNDDVRRIKNDSFELTVYWQWKKLVEAGS